ncbi:nudix domain-containing [Fusarium sporotrichioides]|uniref:Nudix domain-containing n=1 Tax=Fusarium sporotrichioides TaxID=5514 RepID=A0A395RVX7_FUSSP|nr:nudix domain-containing [Fusarium sporotrichioides]
MESIGQTLHLSDQFVISCGTVTLDVERSKILLIRWRKTDEIFLPKGRKDVNESLEKTALRETFEETGVQAQLLPAAINTLATTPSSQNCPSGLATEPIAVSQRMHNGILKIIFWYITSADSTITPVQGTQQPDEQFDTIWEDLSNIDSTISFLDDQRIVRAAIDAVQRGVTQAA